MSSVATRGFRDVRAWQESMTLARTQYMLAGAFPNEEAGTLTFQLQSAAIGVPTSIAEAWVQTDRDEAHACITSAIAGLVQVETLVQLAYDLGWMDEADTARTMGQIYDLHRQIGSIQLPADITPPSPISTP